MTTMKRLHGMLDELDDLYGDITSEITQQMRAIERRRQEIEKSSMFGQYDDELVDAFFSRPYAILPRSRKKNEWYLIVPKFIEMQVGYLLQSTDSYNVFVVNKYADYLGTLPDEFRALFDFGPSLPLKIVNGTLLTGREHQDAAWERYSKYLHQRDGDDKIRIKKSKVRYKGTTVTSRFALVANLIDDGILPFMHHPVQDEHVVGDAAWTSMSEKVAERREMDFFQQAVDKFMTQGSIGLFWAGGVGKTIFGLEMLSRIRVDDRPNVVVAGTKSAIREQWENRLNNIEPAAETIVVNFQSWHKVKDKDIGLLIVDECLPYHSKILLADGSYRSIGDIVMKGDHPSVLTFNVQTGELEPKRVINHFRIPRHNRLVRVHHEHGFIDCTEDHKIFTVEDGYVAARDLTSEHHCIRWKVLPSDERMSVLWRETVNHELDLSPYERYPQCRTVSKWLSMPYMQEAIRNNSSTQWTSGNRTSERSTIEKSTEENKAELLERFEENIQEIERETQGYLIDQSARTVNSRQSIGRYEHSEKFETTQSAIEDTTFIETTRICYVEVLNTQKSSIHPTEDYTKQRLGAEIQSIYNNEFTLSSEDLCSCLTRQEKDGLGRLVKRDTRPLSSSGMVYGRWLFESSKPSSNHIDLLFFRNGKPSVSRLAQQGMEDQSDSTLFKGLSLPGIEKESNVKILRNGTSRNQPDSLYDVQNYVYDLEIEDNHNFFADNILVSNCHALPANTFSDVSLARDEYRIGLSMSPHREDGRTDFIIAMSGPPHGLDWQTHVELGLIHEPDIRLFLCEDYNQKKDKVGELLQYPKKTLIYCYEISKGKALSKQFEIPFVYGDTPVDERLEIVNNSKVTIVSSAMGEGVSVPDIERTIEYNFHFGSKREEIQFMGRLLHGEEGGEHIILMTDEEEEKYGKRLFSILEKGFTIDTFRIGGGVPQERSRPVKTTNPKPKPKPKPTSTPAPTVTRQKNDEIDVSNISPAKKIHPDDKYPFIDERREFNKEMIIEILKSEYARKQRGLKTSEIREVLDHNHVKYGEWYHVRNMTQSLYDDMKISAMREGKARRYFVSE